MEGLAIRRAGIDDADAIGALIADLLPFLTLHPDGRGAAGFIASVGAPAQRRYLAQPNFRYHVAADGGSAMPAGVVAMRDNGHLFHLFVRRDLHGRGLGRQLWEFARDEAIALGNPGTFTVNASDHAVAMYRRLGFVPAAPRAEHDGIAYLPMRWQAG
ncbi:acetyltransferase (GNAT) family protein [Pseudoduganella flava]|uniref:Acetyltransferase (GNAT) family protein n=1 Tax=Pseudoduganella flava TaxID=871742 RepID=A0A562PSX6_9BURK|nr:GNAT family N-acetyltransferase [Pseudoduganella flava]QGZ39160.1 GNAT family N-acetyltransferase [Pseudoduganella flava]TWI47552.1 acetyltransferase (GNAT) family protein [Pseudoduganella flava]